MRHSPPQMSDAYFRMLCFPKTSDAPPKEWWYPNGATHPQNEWFSLQISDAHTEISSPKRRDSPPKGVMFPQKEWPSPKQVMLPQNLLLSLQMRDGPQNCFPPQNYYFPPMNYIPPKLSGSFRAVPPKWLIFPKAPCSYKCFPSMSNSHSKWATVPQSKWFPPKMPVFVPRKDYALQKWAEPPKWVTSPQTEQLSAPVEAPFLKEPLLMNRLIFLGIQLAISGQFRGGS